MTPWTVACLAPLSMGFLRQECGVGCHVLLQGIFLTQRLNLYFLHCRQILYHCIAWEALIDIKMIKILCIIFLYYLESSVHFMLTAHLTLSSHISGAQ